MNNYTSIKPATKEKKSATKNSIMRVFLVAVAILLQCYFLYLVLVQIEKNYECTDAFTAGEPVGRNVIAITTANAQSSMITGMVVG